MSPTSAARFGKRHRKTSRPDARRLALEPLEDRRMLAVVTVDTNLDLLDPLDGLTSLREAIAETNSLPGADHIHFDAELSGQTILLGGTELAITDAVTIDAAALDENVTIDAQLNSGVLNFGSSTGDFSLTGDLTLAGLNIQHGVTTDFKGGGIFFFSDGTLSLSDSTVSGNSWGIGGRGDAIVTSSTISENGGSGISISGDVTVTSSSISGNSRFGIATTGEVTVTSSSISGNTKFGIHAWHDVAVTSSNISANGGHPSSKYNGGIQTTIGDVTVTSSNISENIGGGIRATGDILVTSSTVFRNSMDDFGVGFGGIWASGNATVTSTSVSGNAGNAGGGIRAQGNVAITQSIVSGNSTAEVGASGGGIFASGDITLVESDVNGNNTAGNYASGGGVYSLGTIKITQSTVSGNSTAGVRAGGGGIFASGDLTLIESNVNDNNTTGNYAPGGGVFSSGEVILIQSGVSGNTGSGIRAYDNVMLTRSTVSGNQFGGIWSKGDVKLTQSTVSGNDGNGGIFSREDVTLTQSTVSGNSASGNKYGLGGGIRANGNVTLKQSTVSGNSAEGDIDGSGGGIVGGSFGGGNYSQGDVTLTQSTVSGNSAKADRNVHGGGVWSKGDLKISNSIVAGNTANTDTSDLQSWLGTATVHYSLIGDNAGTGLLEAQTPDANGNLIGSSAGGGVIDPLLGPLADNGGPTLTHALLEGSPAIDAGDPSFIPPPDYDQRGAEHPRVVGNAIDMGAFETISVEEQLSNLLGAVQALLDDGALNRGQGNALSVKLNQIQKKHEKGQTDVALNQLNAFSNQVTAFVAGGVLTPEQGQSLLNAVDILRRSMSPPSKEEIVIDLALASHGLEDRLFVNAKQGDPLRPSWRR